MAISVTLRNCRLHREVKVDFDPSRTLISGPNETGNGTLIEAVHRAFFLKANGNTERHRALNSSLHAGQSPPDAQDLTQEFFCHLLEKRWLASADPDKGKLRTFLIVMLKNFMAKEWRRASAQKRGGGQAHARFDTSFAESRYAADPNSALATEETFDRQWALTLLNLTVERLQTEFAAAGKPADFDALKDCLMAARGTIDYAALAAKLGVNEGAERVAAHRLRKRFREIYREEIAQTLADGADVDAELRHMAAIPARQ